MAALIYLLFQVLRVLAVLMVLVGLWGISAGHVRDGLLFIGWFGGLTLLFNLLIRAARQSLARW